MAVSDRLRLCSKQGRLMVPFFFRLFLRMKTCLNSAPVAQQNKEVGDTDSHPAHSMRRAEDR